MSQVEATLPTRFEATVLDIFQIPFIGSALGELNVALWVSRTDIAEVLEREVVVATCHQLR